MSETEDHDAGSVPGAPEPTKLRRGMFGYRRADVDAALGDRDALLAELRQDVAALWLAFAQHDRMIRQELLGESPPAPESLPEPEPTSSPDQSAVPPADPIAAAEGPGSIGSQLADLDEVLAAIEMATQTLERSYAEEIAEPDAPTDNPPDPDPDPPDPDPESKAD